MNESILQGSLKAVRIPDVLTFLNYLKKTGTLTVEGDGQTHSVYFHNGEIVFATSSDPEESLGNYLVRRGKITQEQNVETVCQIAPGKRHGKVLVAEGLLTPSELWHAVQSQVLEIIYDLFPLKEGSFQFEETEHPNEEKIKLSLPATNIILEGVRRMDEWPRIHQMIPDDRAVPVLEPQERRDAGVQLSPDERSILRLVDGKRKIRDILRKWPHEEFEARRSLANLIMARYIYLPSPTAQPPKAEREDTAPISSYIAAFNEVSSMIAGHLGQRLSPESVQELLQGAVESVKAPELAGVEFDETGSIDPLRLLSNVADYPAEKRRESVGNALAGLLSSLFVASDFHLNAGEKSSLIQMAEKLAQAHARS